MFLQALVIHIICPCPTVLRCVLLADREGAAKNEEERQAVKAERRKHVALVGAEREELKKRSKAAKDHPDK